MADEGPYGLMLHEMCVGMGFCGGLRNGNPSHVNDFVPKTGKVTVEQFLDWLFTAEGDGYPLGYEAKSNPHYEKLRAIFVKHMGSDSVDASKLRDDD